MKKFGKGLAKFFGGILKFFKDMKSELKKVVWPTRSQLFNNTGVVLVFILVIGVAIWILDYLFTSGATLILPKTIA